MMMMSDEREEEEEEEKKKWLVECLFSGSIEKPVFIMEFIKTETSE
jgi:hypothetical protein